MFNFIINAVSLIEYPSGGSSKKGSHIYSLLQGFLVILLCCQKCCFDATMVTWCHNSTIWHHNTSTMATINRKYTWLPYCFCTPVGIPFEVLRIDMAFRYTTDQTINDVINIRLLISKSWLKIKYQLKVLNLWALLHI